jgi:lactate dehydrogenase-like 2-hydroxyacid dehydrogenase
MKRIAVTCELPPEIMKEFVTNFDTVECPLRGASLLDVSKALEGCDAIVLAPPTRADRSFFDARPKSLKAIATYSVGHDHLDLDAAKRARIAVLHTPDVLTDAVADTAILLMLGAARRVTESAALIRSRAWQGWTPTQLLGVGLSGRSLGVFGFGRIGRAIATRAKAFGMSIHYYDDRKRSPQADDAGQLHIDADEFLSAIDVLVLASPLNDQTRYFLDATKLRVMKPSTIVVNIGRGDLLVDDDLIAALGENRILGAGLDVFSNEPNIDPRYFALPNVFMLPHIGSSTVDARLLMARALANGLKILFEGGAPTNRLA